MTGIATIMSPVPQQCVQRSLIASQVALQTLCPAPVVVLTRLIEKIPFARDIGPETIHSSIVAPQIAIILTNILPLRGPEIGMRLRKQRSACQKQHCNQS